MKTYIITGASSDIGTAFLRKLEKDGEKITAYCQYFSNDSKLKELQSEFKNEYKAFKMRFIFDRRYR